MKEAVRLVLDGVTKQMPFRNYYEQRNGRVARDIAGFCGIDYVGCDGGSYDKGSLYLVPAKTVTKRQAEILGASFMGWRLNTGLMWVRLFCTRPTH